MRHLISSLFLAATMVPALGNDVPFAERTPSSSRDPHSSSLGELMELVQIRHIKLWYAGQANNKELALYNLSGIAEGLSKAAMLYQNIPVKFVLSLNEPLHGMQKALDDGNAVAFTQNFTELTTVCNACHRAANVGFIFIKEPTSLPFSDQRFTPNKKLSAA